MLLRVFLCVFAALREIHWYSSAHAEGCALMTFLAVAKVCLAESAFAIVACEAALSAAAGEVLEGGGRGDLSRLRQSGPDDVAVCTIKALAWAVCGVAKAKAEGTTRRGRATVAADAVTHAAG